MLCFILGKSAVFKVHIALPSPVRVPQSEFVGALLLGDFTRGFEPQEFKALRANLFDPRDCWQEKERGQDKGWTYYPTDKIDKTGARMNFVFAFDTMPLECSTKILHFEVADCVLLKDFQEFNLFLHVPVAVTLVCPELDAETLI